VIRSMTGFGSSVKEDADRRAEVEMRSVNHRYLKVVQKLPQRLASLEPRIEDLVREKVRRGALTINVRLEERQAAPRFRLHREAVNAYLEDIAELQAVGGGAPASPEANLPLALSLPGVVRESEEEGSLPAEAVALVLEAVRDALDDLVTGREREGAHLADLLREHRKRLREILEQARERAARLPAEHRDRLLQRVRRLMQEVAGDVELSESDVLREVCLIADRLDVTEELGRLEGHLAALDRILAAGDEVGRQLDFLLQELNRETNTIGSKANDTELSHLVVEMKCEIERIREQVQNLE